MIIRKSILIAFVVLPIFGCVTPYKTMSRFEPVPPAAKSTPPKEMARAEPLPIQVVPVIAARTVTIDEPLRIVINPQIPENFDYLSAGGTLIVPIEGFRTAIAVALVSSFSGNFPRIMLDNKESRTGVEVVVARADLTPSNTISFHISLVHNGRNVLETSLETSKRELKLASTTKTWIEDYRDKVVRPLTEQAIQEMCTYTYEILMKTDAAIAFWNDVGKAPQAQAGEKNLELFPAFKQYGLSIKSKPQYEGIQETEIRLSTDQEILVLADLKQVRTGTHPKGAIVEQVGREWRISLIFPESGKYELLLFGKLKASSDSNYYALARLSFNATVTEKRVVYVSKIGQNPTNMKLMNIEPVERKETLPFAPWGMSYSTYYKGLFAEDLEIAVGNNAIKVSRVSRVG